MDSGKINNLIKFCLTDLPGRQKEVVEGRYGLNGAAALTLAELGDRYGLTRERVRQIESIALKAIAAKTKSADFSNFLKNVSVVLRGAGGIKREDFLMEEVGGASLTNKVKFLLEVSGQIGRSGESNSLYPFWYLGEGDRKKAESFINNLVKSSNRDNFAAGFSAAAKQAGISEAVARSYASVSKKIALNVYGDLGLSEWEEINPKTSRDWAYLVLRKEKKPMHFTELAEAITRLRNKPTHAPTVHNELIKDDKFVLVGKGTYTLQEFGVNPGTARELIVHYLQKHGPLKANDVVKMVLQERIFKENTVLINLQNRKHFKRLEDGRYTTLA